MNPPSKTSFAAGIQNLKINFIKAQLGMMIGVLILSTAQITVGQTELRLPTPVAGTSPHAATASSESRSKGRGHGPSAKTLSPVDWVRVKFEVDGKEVSKGHKIVLYLKDQIIEPMVVDGGFIVPPQLKEAEFANVHFTSGKYDVIFNQVYPSKFKGDWRVGVDRKPFDPDNLSGDLSETTKIIYYIEFDTHEGDGTKQVVFVPETDVDSRVGMSPERVWLTLPSSPLAHHFSPSKRDISLLNRTSRTVIGYQIGCVVQEANKIKAVHKLPFIATNVEGGKSIFNSFSLYAHEAAQCYNDNGRLGVVEVAFKDESHWVAPTEPPSKGSNLLHSERTKVTQAVVPEYPLLALHSHTSGEVLLDVKINSKGSVTSVEPVSGPQILVISAKYVARYWKFEPSSNPNSSPRVARLTFAYRLLPTGTPAEKLGSIFRAPNHLEIVAALPDERPLPTTVTIKN